MSNDNSLLPAGGARQQNPTSKSAPGASAPASETGKPRHRLDPDRIVETATNLASDVAAHLPGSALASLAGELKSITATARDRGHKARKPIVAVRLLSAVAIVAGLLGLWYVAGHIHAKWEFGTVNEVFDGIHTGFELFVMFTGALWFCATLESRIKRKAALTAIEELREFIHVIDVTQLYYTPDLYGSRVGGSSSPLSLDESYLLYCTQMLAVISNLAPLYTRGAPGDSVLRAASDVEMLAIAVSTKHMSKAEVVRALHRQG